MTEATSVLFGIEDEFDVVSVARIGPGRSSHHRDAVGGGAVSGVWGDQRRVKDRPLRRIKDLPACGQRVELWWRKRRLVCAEQLCPRRSFTRPVGAIRPRARVTERLREQARVGDRGREPGGESHTSTRGELTCQHGGEDASEASARRRLLTGHRRRSRCGGRSALEVIPRPPSHAAPLGAAHGGVSMRSGAIADRSGAPAAGGYSMDRPRSGVQHQVGTALDAANVRPCVPAGGGWRRPGPGRVVTARAASQLCLADVQFRNGD